MRRLAALLVLVALSWVSPAPADDPEVPEKYMKVDEVKALLDENKRVAFVDVRPKEQFDEMHIRGARSIPLREIRTRLSEIPRQELLVLY